MRLRVRVPPAAPAAEAPATSICMVTTRFAPSPSGPPHLGSLRTALFNYLWARHNRGRFILRIEDTDQARNQPGALDLIKDSLSWLGLDWDFGPDRDSPDFGSCQQSQRLNSYKPVVDQLINRGLAYYDQTSPDQLQQFRQEAKQAQKPFVFRQNRSRYDPRSQKPTVVRLAIPDRLTISWTDAVKADQSWSGTDIGDFVILKADGYPTYHLANVVDDHLMAINYVIRGDEWLSSTPKHLYLFDCLNWPRPNYCHVPPVMAETGHRKLSKRDHQGSQVDDFKKAGYLPMALNNFLSLLGWNPGTEQEFFASLADLADQFQLSRLQSSPARFDRQRLDWFNGRHIRNLNPADRLQSAGNWWGPPAAGFDDDYKSRVLELVFERLKNWSQLPALTDFFFADPGSVDLSQLTEKTRLNQQQISQINQQLSVIFAGRELPGPELETKLRQTAQELELKAGDIFMVCRIKLTGQDKTPNLIAIIELLGWSNCRRRIEAPSSNG